MTLEQPPSQIREKFSTMIPAEPAALKDGHIDFLRKSGALKQILKFDPTYRSSH